MTKRVLASVAFFALILFSGNAFCAEASALPERILGKPDAPVTILEFASLTCSHCAEFATNVLPELEKRYVETGKVKIIFHDFPIDGIALKASTLAHCMPAEQFYPFLNVLFKNLEQWAFGATPEQTLIQYAKLGGLPEDKAKACLQDTKILDALVAERTKAQDKYNIESTPTFIFNNGEEKLVGARKLEEFTAILDKLLAKKK